MIQFLKDFETLTDRTQGMVILGCFGLLLFVGFCVGAIVDAIIAKKKGKDDV